MRFLLLLMLAFVSGCAGPRVVPAARQEPPKDARYVIVVADERSKVAITGQELPTVYQQGRFILGQKTQGMLQVMPEPKVLQMARAAGVAVDVKSVVGVSPLYLRIKSDDIGRLATVAASQGVDYIIVVNDYTTRRREYEHDKDGRLKLLGGLGISYKVTTGGYETKRALDIGVWRCKTGRQLFTQKFEVSSGGGLREHLDLDEWLGMTILQRLLPFATQTAPNPSGGDYAFHVDTRASHRMNRRNPPTSGTLGVNFDIPMTTVARVGEEVRLTVPLKNYYDVPLSVNFMSDQDNAFCLDKNGGHYGLVRAEGPTGGTISAGATRTTTWVFQIPDRNVDFVNLHLRVRSHMQPDYEGVANLQWENIPLFPVPGPQKSQPAPLPAEVQAPPQVRSREPAALAPSATVPEAGDGSAWYLRDINGQLYSSQTCMGQPVVVYFCSNSLLQNTGMFSENSDIGRSAKRFAELFKRGQERGITFLWIDESYARDPALNHRTANRYKLGMPVVTGTANGWSYPITGQPWMMVFDAQGRPVKTMRGANEILQFYGAQLDAIPATPQDEKLHTLFADDHELTALNGGAKLKYFTSAKATFTQNYDAVWEAAQKSIKGGTWQVDPTEGTIYSRSYIYEGYWNLLGPSRCCRHVVSISKMRGKVEVQVITPMWTHTVHVSDATGKMVTTHDEKPDYDTAKSLELSNKFLASLRKRLGKDVR